MVREYVYGWITKHICPLVRASRMLLFIPEHPSTKTGELTPPS